MAVAFRGTRNKPGVLLLLSEVEARGLGSWLREHYAELPAMPRDIYEALLNEGLHVVQPACQISPPACECGAEHWSSP